MIINFRIATCIIPILFFGACASQDISGDKKAKNSLNQTQAVSNPISGQRLAESEFKSKGVKVFYSLFGDIVAIEATGYAAVSGNSASAARESYRVAELEAKRSLSEFINQETITSTTSVKMISSNLERAQDKATSRASSELVAIDTEVATSKTKEDVATRNNAVAIAKQLQTTITTQNKGILGGLYLKESGVIDGGRSVKVVMRWDKKHNDSRKQIRNLMAQ